MGDKVVNTVSEMSHENLQKATAGSKAALDKGLVTAKQLRQSRVVKLVERNPVKTLGAVAALGLIAYSIFGRKKGQALNSEHE